MKLDVDCCSGNFEERESDGFIWRHRYFYDNFKIIDVNTERAEKLVKGRSDFVKRWERIIFQFA